MGLIKDFKEDFAQAVNELTPGSDDMDIAEKDYHILDTLGEDVDVQAEL